MGEEVCHSDLATFLTLIYDGFTMGDGCFILFCFIFLFPILPPYSFENRRLTHYFPFC